MFSLDISILTYCLVGATALFALLFALLMFGKLKRVTRRSLTDAKLTMPADDRFPSVSVLVHDDARAWNLPELLPRILEQDYPAEMEVIVVNDGSRGATEEIISRLEGRYANLYMTFLPQESRSLSRRKLALMLGIKAARYDMVALVGGNCMIDSPMWLRAMMRHVVRGKELVIGWAYPALPPKAANPVTGGSRCRWFDIVRTAVQYLAWGAAGHPWRGDGNNLAFSRRLFYEHNGFANSLNLVRGDDDIWVKEVATRENCAVELSPEAMVAVMDEDLVGAHRLDKLRHDFTSRRPGRGARLTFALASWMWWLALGCGIGAAVTGLPSLLPLIAVVVIGCMLCVPYMVRWRRVSSRLHGRKLFLTVPWFTTWHPFYTLLYRLRGRMTRRDNFTAGKLL